MKPKDLEKYGIINTPNIDINNMTKKQLYSIASACNIRGRSTINKNELKAAIQKNNCETDPLKITKKALRKKGPTIDSYFNHDGKRCDLIMPKIVGRWAGDRIVIAGDYGDYGDKGKFIPQNQPINKEKWKKDSGYADYYIDDHIHTTNDVNLYHYANVHNYKDISKDVVKAMQFDPWIKKAMKNGYCNLI